MLWNLSISNVFKEVFSLCFGLSLSLTPLTKGLCKGLSASAKCSNYRSWDLTKSSDLKWVQLALVLPDRCVSKPVFHYFSGNFFQHCPCVGNFSWWQSRIIPHVVWVYSWITWRWKRINFFPLCSFIHENLCHCFVVFSPNHRPLALHPSLFVRFSWFTTTFVDVFWMLNHWMYHKHQYLTFYSKRKH